MVLLAGTYAMALLLLEGTLDLLSRSVELKKEHLGAYTNVVLYYGSFDESRCCIDGTYSNGTISLAKLSDSADQVRRFRCRCI